MISRHSSKPRCFGYIAYAKMHIILKVYKSFGEQMKLLLSNEIGQIKLIYCQNNHFIICLPLIHDRQQLELNTGLFSNLSKISNIQDMHMTQAWWPRDHYPPLLVCLIIVFKGLITHRAYRCSLNFTNLCTTPSLAGSAFQMRESKKRKGWVGGFENKLRMIWNWMT